MQMACSTPKTLQSFVQLYIPSKKVIQNSVSTRNVAEVNLKATEQSKNNEKVLNLISSKLKAKLIEKADCQSILDNLGYCNFSDKFNCNMFDNILAFTLHAKNANSSPMQHFKNDKFKFIDIKTANNEHLRIFIVEFNKDIEEYEVFEDFALDKKFNEKPQITEFSISFLQNDEIEIELKLTDEEKQLNKNVSHLNISDSTKRNKKLTSNKKRNRICRSISESSKDDFKFIDMDQKIQISRDIKLDTEITDDNNSTQRTVIWKKYRSISESRSIEEVKGILKRTTRQGRSYSTSEKYSSLDSTCSDSCSQALDNNSTETEETPEYCKKTVRFSDIIRKQLFRMDSSILGQRKKNQKKRCQKQRAIQRRNSESDLVTYNDVVLKI